MKKVLLLDAISFQADPNDEIWRYENVAQIKYAEAQNKVILDYLGKDVVAKMHGQVEYISNQGLLILGYLLKQSGIFVSYTNGDYFDSEKDYIADIQTNYADYDVYCFTSTTPQFNHVRRLAQAVKSMNGNAKTILGGPHTRYFMTNDKDAAFDYMVIGYGIDKIILKYGYLNMFPVLSIIKAYTTLCYKPKEQKAIAQKFRVKQGENTPQFRLLFPAKF